MIKIRSKYAKVVIFSILTLILIPFTSHAQTSTPSGPPSDLRLTTSPLPINLKTTPGTQITANLKVKNDGLQAENIKVTLMKFKANGDSGAPMLLEKESTDEFMNWVTFSEPSFTLPPNEWKTITATFNIPQTASFGYYYAVVFQRADEQVQIQDRQAVITGGTATLILLDVQVPNAKREVQVTEFQADKSSYEFLPATFTIKLKNTGNVHIAPRGNIFISKGDTSDVATLEVNATKGSILPDSPRTFTQQWKDGFPVYEPKTKNGSPVLDDNNNQEQTLTWNWKDASKLRWGHYTAKLLLVYDDGQKDVPIEAEVSFWIVPWRLIFGSIGILVLFFFLGRLSNKISFRKKKKTD